MLRTATSQYLKELFARNADSTAVIFTLYTLYSIQP